MIQRTLNIQTGEMVDVEVEVIGETRPLWYGDMPEYILPVQKHGSALRWGFALLVALACLLCLVVYGLDFISLFY